MATNKRNITARISLEGAQDVLRDLDQMGTRGEAAAKKLKAALEGAVIDKKNNLSKRLDDMRVAFNRLGAAGTAFLASFRRLGTAINGFGSALANTRRR